MVRLLMIRFLRRPKFLVAVVAMLLFFLGLLIVRKRLSSFDQESDEKHADGKSEMKSRLLGRFVNIRGAVVDEDDTSRTNLPDSQDSSLEIERTKAKDATYAHTVGKKKAKSPISHHVRGNPNELPRDKTTMGTEAGSSPEPNYRVHIFYYPWYGNPKFDGKFIHWNHEYLPHWNAEIAERYQRGRHVPPDDIGANFYPALGPYSSMDPLVMEDHMKQMQTAGVGVLVTSWYPPGKADGQGIPWDNLVEKLLNVAAKHKLKVALHIEPYDGRNDQTVHKDVEYIINKYSKHEAFYKHKTKDGRYLPVLYIYDSYHTKPHEWAQLLTPSGSHSVRNTKYDCLFICLMVEMSHRLYVENGGFDGFYTYFAVDQFTYGSTWRSWPQLSSLARQTKTLFIPSVGPGYIDTNVRPWNVENTRSRENGDYYRKSWKAALNVDPDIITVTSFNEWHEGTQIEKAVPKSVSGLVYRDYAPNQPDFYLKLTKEFVDKFGTKNEN